MADKAREWTDKKLAKMEREISLMYKKSAKDLYKKWDAYIGRGDKRIQTLEKDLRDAFKVGDEQVIAEVEERLKKAKEAFTYKNDYYKHMLNSITYDMAQVNNDVRAYVNGQLPEIYAKNYAQANEIVKGMKLDFALPNEQAIKARILEGKVKTPFMRTDKFIKIPKDQRWNTKFINSQVMQGIIQGEDMRTISKRIFPEIQAKNGGLPERNRASAIRNARTLVTGAENQGKHDSYEFLSDNGLVIKQVWIATGDDRTREAHLEMDGQEVEIGEPFIAINRDGSECELEYPADPNGDAEQVYNCRCALTARVVGFRNEDGTIREIEEEDEGQDLHDRQIAQERAKRGIQAESEQPIKEEKQKPIFVPAETVEEAEKYAQRFVEESKWSGSGNVSYKGMSIEVANQVNEALTYIFNEYNLPPLRNIEPMNLRQKIFKDAKDAPFCYRSLFAGDFYFNPNIIKTQKTIEKYMQKGKEAFDYCTKNIDKFSGRQRELVETYLKAGRQTVADTVENPLKAMIDHEMGHHFQHQIIASNKDYVAIVKDGFDEYGVKISGYATYSVGEYIAESFSAINNGNGNLIDPKLKRMFMELRR